jgi:hypothetical protein
MPLLSPSDQYCNYLFRGGDLQHNEDDPWELIQRVADGVKPTAVIVLVNLRKKEQKKVLARCEALGLYCTTLTNRWEIKCLCVCKKGATLAEYWDYESIACKYERASVSPPCKRVFDGTVSSFLHDLANEDLGLPEIGLLYGYPVEETIKLFEFEIKK